MRFEIDFANVETGARKTITVILTPQEMGEIRAGAYEDFDVIFMAKALKHAYREAGDDFRHTCPPRRLDLH